MRPRTVVTGGTGRVGSFIVAGQMARGNRVRVIGRQAPGVAGVDHAALPLSPETDYRRALDGAEVLVHCALAHAEGRYRGGEGDDPAGFRRANEEGTARLFRDAARAGVRRVIFLSTRAVYGVQPPGARLDEATEPRPDTLYGAVKLAGERALAALHPAGVSLRVTGVYGPPPPGRAHKWQGLLDDLRAGREVAPRVATEVHGADVAAAVALAETAEPGVLNVSDLVLDRRDLLAAMASRIGITPRLPEAGDAAGLNVMETGRLRALGWVPGGRDLLERHLTEWLGPPERA